MFKKEQAHLVDFAYFLFTGCVLDEEHAPESLEAAEKAVKEAGIERAEFLGSLCRVTIEGGHTAEAHGQPWIGCQPGLFEAALEEARAIKAWVEEGDIAARNLLASIARNHRDRRFGPYRTALEAQKRQYAARCK